MNRYFNYIIDNLYLKRIGPLIHKNGVCDSDIFFLSYPKSGRTWIRYFFSCYIAQLSGEDLPVKWGEFTKYTPSYRMGLIGAGLALRNYNYSDIRTIWTHDKYAAKYLPRDKAVFITRDIVSIIESYYFFHRTRNGIHSSYESLDEYALTGFDHNKCLRVINSFAKNLPAVKHLKLISYEDLKINSEDIFKELLIFSGFDWNERFFNKAHEYSSFKNMRLAETIETNLNEKDLHLRSGNSRGETSVTESAATEIREIYSRNLPSFLSGYWSG